MKDIAQINKSWTEFKVAFWVIFLMKLASKSSLELTSYSFILSVQIIAIIMMVCLVGYYSYKFSGKKLLFLNGLLGLFWFATIGILISYFAVKRVKNYQIKKVSAESQP